MLYLEHYTSVLAVGKERLESLYGKPVILADRETCEDNAQSILDAARAKSVAFLVVGSPFAATTHMDLMIRAQRQGVQTTVSHNASIMNSIAACGLQLYSFGQSVSICLFEGAWRPSSFYEKLQDNVQSGAHTMCLLDIKIKEVSYANLMKGVKKYEPPRFLTADVACRQMLEVEREKKGGVLLPSTPVMAVCRCGQPTQLIVSGTLEELSQANFGAPLHTLVVPGNMHILEKEMFDWFDWRRTLSDQKSSIKPTPKGDRKIGEKEVPSRGKDAIVFRTATELVHALTAPNAPKEFIDEVLRRANEAAKRTGLQLGSGRAVSAAETKNGATCDGEDNEEFDDEPHASDSYAVRRLKERRRAQKLAEQKREAAAAEECDDDDEEEEEEEDDDDDDEEGKDFRLFVLPDATTTQQG